MGARRKSTALAAGVLVCAVASLAQAQSVSSKGAAKPLPAKPAVAKPETRPAAAVTGGAEPTLIGQFGNWGAGGCFLQAGGCPHRPIRVCVYESAYEEQQ